MAGKRTHDALIALGGNLGDRARYLHRAVRALGQLGEVRDTSFLYETDPVLLEDQPRFLNAACRLATSLSPHELLRGLQRIERDMGRIKNVRYGPRIIDLDLCFLADCVVDDPPFLILPHYQATVRGFVLEPLCDMVPDFVNPTTGRTLREHWRDLGSPPMERVLPVRGAVWSLEARTRIAGAMNASPESELAPGIVPDSSEGRARFQERVHQCVRDGADCIDLGAQSTRPGHTLLPEEEEIRRLTWAVDAVRAVTDLPLAIDTFRPAAAAAALERGADMINDVWAGRFAPELTALTASRGIPHIFMHNRLRVTDGNYPAAITRQARFTASTRVAERALDELAPCLAEARARGQCRWLQVMDPGLGYGKNPTQNAALLRDLATWIGTRHPVMVGPSRKAFIGRLLHDPSPAAREAGALAAGLLAAQRGTALIRTHDVKATRSALEMLVQVSVAD